MTTKTKMALVAALVLGSSSMALAQGTVHARHHHSSQTRSFQSRDVALPQATVPAAEENWMDRASESFSGGGY